MLAVFEADGGGQFPLDHRAQMGEGLHVEQFLVDEFQFLGGTVVGPGEGIRVEEGDLRLAQDHSEEGVGADGTEEEEGAGDVLSRGRFLVDAVLEPAVGHPPVEDVLIEELLLAGH